MVSCIELLKYVVLDVPDALMVYTQQSKVGAKCFGSGWSKHDKRVRSSIGR
ncbi:hypothetical protein JCM18905_2903 [Vibrio sp. JCM 18905]|nr:hypothetical protein JCM18905_2903 [Vibrio sp. JCM 18905]